MKCNCSLLVKFLFVAMKQLNSYVVVFPALQSPKVGLGLGGAAGSMDSITRSSLSLSSSSSRNILTTQGGASTQGTSTPTVDTRAATQLKEAGHPENFNAEIVSRKLSYHSEEQGSAKQGSKERGIQQDKDSSDRQIKDIKDKHKEDPIQNSDITNEHDATFTLNMPTERSGDVDVTAAASAAVSPPLSPVGLAQTYLATPSPSSTSGARMQSSLGPKYYQSNATSSPWEVYSDPLDPLQEADEEGLVGLCVGLLDLMSQSLPKLNEEQRQKLIGSVILAETLIVMAHHSSSTIRAAVVRVSIAEGIKRNSWMDCCKKHQ